MVLSGGWGIAIMTVQSGFKERRRSVPLVIAASGRVMIPVLLLVAGLSGFRESYFSLEHLAREAPPTLITLLVGWLSGVVIGPLLLPWLPGEGYSFKGAMAGGLGLLAWPAACGFLHLRPVDVGMALLLAPALASFWMMRLAVVMAPDGEPVGQRERRVGLVIQAGMAAAALTPWVMMRVM